MEEITQNYRAFIETTLKNNKITDPTTYLDWNGSPSEIEERLILFLADKHPDGEEVGMFTRSSLYVTIKLNEDSGSIFYLEESKANKTFIVAIYVGESKAESGAKVSYFYVRSDSGLSYFTYQHHNLKDLQKLDIDILRTVLNFKKGQKVLFKKSEEEIPSHFGEIYKNLEMFYDGKIICNDGNVLINRMILCMRSKFFFVYFSKYTNDHNTIKMDVNKIVMEKYMEFLYLHQISGDVLMDSSVELFDFGNMIGDISFIEFIYHKLWDLIDDEQEKMNLNQLMKMYQVMIC